MKNLFVAITIFICIAGLPLVTSASCPEGKSEITILTPSGKMKALCVSDKAVKGIEAAGDHSGGVIVAAQCPCFSQEDIEAAGALSCIGNSGEWYAYRSCDGDAGNHYTAGWCDFDSGFACFSDNLCGTDSIPTTSISEDEATACVGILSAVEP